jgi:hypothetical protein
MGEASRSLHCLQYLHHPRRKTNLQQHGCKIPLLSPPTLSSTRPLCLWSLHGCRRERPPPWREIRSSPIKFPGPRAAAAAVVVPHTPPRLHHPRPRTLRPRTRRSSTAQTVAPARAACCIARAHPAAEAKRRRFSSDSRVAAPRRPFSRDRASPRWRPWIRGRARFGVLWPRVLRRRAPAPQPQVLLRARPPPPHGTTLVPRRHPRARLPPPCVQLAYALEERGDTILHPLSPPKAICLVDCLTCWRAGRACTVVMARQKCFCLVLWDSVSDR